MAKRKAAKKSRGKTSDAEIKRQMLVLEANGVRLVEDESEVDPLKLPNVWDRQPIYGLKLRPGRLYRTQEKQFAFITRSHHFGDGRFVGVLFGDCNEKIVVWYENGLVASDAYGEHIVREATDVERDRFFNDGPAA